MGVAAIAILRVPFKKAAHAFVREKDEEGVELYANHDGQLCTLTELGDCTLVQTFFDFFLSPDELSVSLGQLLGPLLEKHDDDRGLFVFPDNRTPKGKSYDKAIQSVAKEGFWVPIASPERVEQSIEARMNSVVEFMAQMTALNHATREGDDKEVKAARKALAHAFSDAEAKTVRTTHPIASQVRRRGKKAARTLKSAFEGVKLDDVQLPSEWQKAADEARTLILKDLRALRSKKKRK